MKTRISKYLLGWTLLLLAACVKEPVGPNPPQDGIKIPYSATVTEVASTRASLNAVTQYIFSAGDRLHVIAREGEAIKMYGCLEINSGVGERTATFTGELTCAEDYLPVDGTPLTATLLSADSPEGFYTIGSDGALSGPVYPDDAVASSFAEAVSKYGVFTADGTYGAATFSLAQQSSFLLFSVRCDKGVVPEGNPADVSFYNNGGAELVRSGSVTAAAAGTFSRLSFAMAFPGGSTTLNGAKLDVMWDDGEEGHKEFAITDKALEANNYYNVSRDAVDIYKGFRIKGTVNETKITLNYPYTDGGTQYSKDNGHNWTNYTEPVSLNKDEELCVRAKRTTYENGNREFNDNNGPWYNINNKPLFTATQKVYIAGNIMSLLYYEFEDKFTIPTEFCFFGAFGKTSETKTIDIDPDDPLILPATTLTEGCYIRMFFKCTELTTAPKLPATNLADFCYYNIFRECSKLVNVSFVMPNVEQLKPNCYREMFRKCTSLQSVPDAFLPSTTLAEGCYRQMFADDTKLARAPELPAETLVTDCYKQMFSGCSGLNYIKCLATTNINTNNSTFQWVQGVPKTVSSVKGTFVKSPAASSWTTGTNGIPLGWDVQNAQ